MEKLKIWGGLMELECYVFVFTFFEYQVVSSVKTFSVFEAVFETIFGR